MDSPNLEDILIKDDDDLLFFGQEGRKSNSLNDLLGPSNAAKKGPYQNVESKVKTYIAQLPPPNNRRKTFKKHTSMPDCGMDSITHVQLEHEFSEYRRQSEHTIKELEKQVQVAVMMITQANNDNEELIDQIHVIQKELKDSNNRPTPEPQPTIATLVCTPRKAAVNPRGPAHRLLSDDTTGSFIGQTTVPTVTHLAHSPVSESSSVHGKRNLSFNTSGGDTTRRSGGTDSGINTSDGNEVMIQEDPLSGSGAGMLLGGQHDTVPRHERPRKRKRVRRDVPE